MMEGPVMAAQVLTQMSGARKRMDAMNKIVVAHDFSEAADRALADAAALSRHFQSEILIAHIETPGARLFEVQSSNERDNPVHVNVENLTRRVALAGHPCKAIVRCGEVASELSEIVREEAADLLLLGACGKGSRDRTALGSTTELLLRSVPCPVLTYGPKMTRALFQDKEPVSILVPIELPCDPRYLTFAVSVAKLFRAKLEVLHVVDLRRALSSLLRNSMRKKWKLSGWSIARDRRSDGP
jgi:nucleotide-binding universal stress UspA family protein